MIYDRLENSETYSAISERLAEGFRLLQTTDFSAIEPGKYEVDGKELFFMLQSYQSKELNDRPEAHKKYIDIQYILEGEEQIGVGALSEMVEEVSANPDGDIWFYHGPVTHFKMEKGNFAVFFPQDAHAPGIATGDPAPVKKVVVKVLM
ncbi:MAG: YhcH/YjgK/YiaL family protein [Oscillospiraceae bacterium]|nr:YhcH/YjgK/YiaL family protein [Oscillospiraceae bacterium]